MRSLYARKGKRALDVTLASVALIGTSPILAIACAAIILEDRGNPIFRQARAGANGRTFTVYKLRSMPVGTAARESRDATALRVTRVGAVIRRLSIDELPQLMNVVRGDMSIVGPRPALLDQTNLLRLRGESRAAELRPGLTGLAQICSYDGMPEEQKAEYDATYAHKLSLATDLSIIARTFLYLLKPPPTY